MPRRKVQEEAAEEAKGKKNYEKPRKKMKKYNFFLKKISGRLPSPSRPRLPCVPLHLYYCGQGTAPNDGAPAALRRAVPHPHRAGAAKVHQERLVHK